VTTSAAISQRIGSAFNSAVDISGGYDRRRFDHQDDGSFRSAGAMDDALRHHEALVRLKLNDSILKVDDEAAFGDKENSSSLSCGQYTRLLTQPDDRIVDLAQRLLCQRSCCRGQRRHPPAERWIKHVEEGGVRILLSLIHAMSFPSLTSAVRQVSYSC
jgi:hypothetical protein